MNYNFETLAQIEETAAWLKEQVETGAVDATDSVLVVLEKLRDDWRELKATLDEAAYNAAVQAAERAEDENVAKFKAARDEQLALVPAVVSLEGMHKVGDRIFKVQVAVHGSGHLYAKELTRDGDRWVFEYAKGAMRQLSADTKMSLEEAKQFGALYGTCCVCGRTLTNETSIEEGIGPVCAGKF